jgi:hypothetical protein
VTGVLPLTASTVFSVFSDVPSVVKAFPFLQEEKAFNTEDRESVEKTETQRRIKRITPRPPKTDSGRAETMGRTVPTFRQLIDDAIARWSKFRRALRREDQEYFDRLFRRVRTYTQAATYQASDNPMEAILLSIALDQEKRLDALEHAAPRQPGAALPPERIVRQLDAPRSAEENEQPDTQQQLNTDQRMDFRSLPEPAGDDAVADRPEPDAPPAD